MHTATAPSIQTGRWQGLRPAALPVAIGLVALGLLFHREAASAVDVWSVSTAYNHCFLVLPIAIWLAYDRRQWLAGQSLRPLPWLGLLAIPVMALWLAAERLGIMEGRQIMAVACVEILFVATLGWRLSWLLGAPLVYLFFLIPFGGFLTPALQEFTARFIVAGLNAMGIANISDGNTIEIAEGTFYVAEACAGLRFLIASVAFGVLYAVTFYRGPVRRVVFVAASIVIPVVANGVRALGIVAAGHWVGSAQAAAADHLIYGWIFFSMVTMLLIAAGLPFRQDGAQGQGQLHPAVAPSPRTARWPALAWAVAITVLVAAIGPVLANRIDTAAARQTAAAPTTIAGCEASGRDAAATSPADGSIARRFTCQDGAIQLLVVAFPPRTNPSVIVARQSTLSEKPLSEDTTRSSMPGAPGWQLATTTNPFALSASAIWIDGKSATGGLRSRVEQARNSLAGTDHPPVLVYVEPTDATAPAAHVRATLFGFIAANAPAIATQMTAFSATPLSVMPISAIPVQSQ